MRRRPIVLGWEENDAPGSPGRRGEPRDRLKLSRADVAYILWFAFILVGAVWGLTHGSALLDRE